MWLICLSAADIRSLAGVGRSLFGEHITRSIACVAEFEHIADTLQNRVERLVVAQHAGHAQIVVAQIARKGYLHVVAGLHEVNQLRKLYLQELVDSVFPPQARGDVSHRDVAAFGHISEPLRRFKFYRIIAVARHKLYRSAEKGNVYVSVLVNREAGAFHHHFRAVKLNGEMLAADLGHLECGIPGQAHAPVRHKI